MSVETAFEAVQALRTTAAAAFARRAVYTDEANRERSKSLTIKQLQVVKRNGQPAMLVRAMVAARCGGTTHSSSRCVSVSHGRHTRVSPNWVQEFETKAVAGC